MFTRLLGAIIILIVLWKVFGKLSERAYQREEAKLIEERKDDEDNMLDIEDFMELLGDQSDGNRG